jgi:hypothetical protein
MAAGCSAHVTRRGEARLDVRGSNAPAAIVFASPAHPSMAAAGPELARNDASLSPILAAGLSSGEHWPEPDRPSLRHYGRIHFSERANTFIYFEREPMDVPPPGHGHGHRHPWAPLGTDDLRAWW